VPSEFAPAKVNLYLHVVGRDGGYHLLDSLAVFPAIGDELWAEPADSLSLAIEGEHAGSLLAEPENLVLRAARALAEASGIIPRARLVLHKRLPVASGIGGGSADAAAALRLLARLGHVNLGPQGLTLVASGIGKDVRVCLASRPARMRGAGEVLEPAPALPSFGVVLANPGVPVPTAEVFRRYRDSGAGFSAEARLPAAWPDAASMARNLAALGNDLEAPAIALCPVIAEIRIALAALPGCLLARMSGSGATCFGLFATPALAEAAAAQLPARWWRWGGGTFSTETAG
jgi:4-diphosphocytidyl-2-C-methyl-D-erythritol kinase